METPALKLLAIDDNQDNLTTLKAVVQDALPGCVVLSALNGPQGIELARNEDPDVILQIGRASCRKECPSKCRSRWSPYH